MSALTLEVDSSEAKLEVGAALNDIVDKPGATVVVLSAAGSSCTRQASSAQDFTKQGTTHTGKFVYAVVADGHGSKGRNHTINYLKDVDWDTLIDSRDFMQGIISDIDLLNTTRSGSTLSVVRMSTDYIECYFIGDSTIQIYENSVIAYKSKNHDRYNKKEIERISNYGNLRGIKADGVWDIVVTGDNDIKSVPGLRFDFGEGCDINMTHALGHSGKTGNHFQYDKLIIDKSKPYKIVVASDGLWDMFHVGDDSIIGSPYTDAEYLVEKANKRWRQEWTHDNTQEKNKGTRFPEDNIDDICASTINYAPLPT